MRHRACTPIDPKDPGKCPVTVLHGGSDRIVDVIHARHTAELIPGADLVIVDDLGDFSIVTQVVPAIRALLRR
jgi:pimeloyl-ACP methyl ester carboxylesterase